MKRMKRRPIFVHQTADNEWIIKAVYRKKEVYCITTDREAIDAYTAAEHEKVGRKNKRKWGHMALFTQLINQYKKDLHEPKTTIPAGQALPGQHAVYQGQLF